MTTYAARCNGRARPRTVVVWGLIVAVLLVLGVSFEAGANDFGLVLGGTDLFPLQETPIRMVSEEIRFRLDPKRSLWSVAASYRFQNPTKERVCLQVGFPEVEGTPLKAFKTTVRGKTVAHKSVSLAHPIDALPPYISDVYVYSTCFAPGETVDVVHRYTHMRTDNGTADDLMYVTVTGALWSGPIERARFVVLTPIAPWAVEYLDQIPLVSSVEHPSKSSGGMSQLVFEATSWTPTKDFSVKLLGPSEVIGSQGLKCPAWAEVIDGVTNGTLGHSLASYSDEQLKVCRNAVYGVHGRSFADAGINRGLYGAPSPVKGTDTLRVGFRKNAAFAPSLLTPDERTYLSALRAEEKVRSSSPPGE